jgi:ABC-2 type transport system ATP-binding protein
METQGTTTAAINVAGLEKSFGDRAALRRVSFMAGRGELLAVIGPNGAGKTTLLSIIAGSLEADGGGVELADGEGEVGFVPQHAGLYRKLTVAENPGSSIAPTFLRRPNRAAQVAVTAAATGVRLNLPRGCTSRLTAR